MDLITALNTYFEGERDLGFALVPVGIALLAACAWIWRSQEGPFAWGMLIPLGLFALAIGATGVFMAQRSQSQLTTFPAELRADPPGFVQREAARMAKVNANWPRLKATWAALTILALGLILGVGAPWSKGLGLALLVITTTLMVTDVFAERRAAPYTQALRDAGGSVAP